MVQQSGESAGRITRRNALKTGIVLSSGRAIGGGVVGTAGADEPESFRAFPIHHFVRAEGASDEEPASPIPDPRDRIVERKEGNPIDDGDEPGEVDGTHQLTWGEFSAVDGFAAVECDGDDTDLVVEMSGLVPGAQYTIWVIVFEEPGFVASRDLDVALENMVGFGPLGEQDGSQSAFRGGSVLIEVTHEPGELANLGYEVDGCLLEEFEVHLAAALHLDGKTHGSVPGPEDGLWAEQLGFTFGTGI